MNLLESCQQKGNFETLRMLRFPGIKRRLYFEFKLVRRLISTSHICPPSSSSPLRRFFDSFGRDGLVTLTNTITNLIVSLFHTLISVPRLRASNASLGWWASCRWWCFPWVLSLLDYENLLCILVSVCWCGDEERARVSKFREAFRKRARQFRWSSYPFKFLFSQQILTQIWGHREFQEDMSQRLIN